MNTQLFDENDLPLEDFQAIGLTRGNRIDLTLEDKAALLAGRRTDLLRLENLEMHGLKIASINAKLSLVTGADGKPELLIHPTYLRSIPPTYLNDNEVEALESGEDKMLEKDIVDGNGQRKRVLVEFDPETNQFLETDEDKLQSPVEINGFPLSPEQKARYKRGEEVEVPDGTKLRYTATNREGIRANRIGLIASIILDGGISYLLFHGLRTLTGHSSDFQDHPPTNAYLDTLAKAQTKEMADEEIIGDNLKGQFSSHGNQHSRGYGRTSAR